MTDTPSSSISVWQTLTEIDLVDQSDVDQLAWDHVAGVVRLLNLAPAELERLRTTISKAILKVIQRGHHNQTNLPVSIKLRVSYKTLGGSMTGRKDMPNLTASVPAQEFLRGWGFFLIERMVGDIQTVDEDVYYSIELFLYQE